MHNRNLRSRLTPPASLNLIAAFVAALLFALGVAGVAANADTAAAAKRSAGKGKLTDAAKVKAEEWDSIFTETTGQAYAVAEGPWLNATGVWSQGGRTFALSARVESLYMLERLLERPEFLTEDEWAIALQPGGAEWLVDHHFGDGVTAERVTVNYAKVKGPDGKVSYEACVKPKAPRKSHR